MSPEQPLSAEPIWNQVVAFALAQAKSGVSGKDLLAVAIRSPEFSAANQLLNKGSKLEDIVFTALALLGLNLDRTSFDSSPTCLGYDNRPE